MNEKNEKNRFTRELCVLHNDAEGLGMESLFAEEGIDVVIFKRQDTAGPGVFDRDAEWGVARVAEADFDRAKDLWQKWLDADPADIGDDWQQKTETGDLNGLRNAPPGATGWFMFVFGVVVGCVVMYLYLT